MLTGDYWKTASSLWRSACKLFNAASKDRDLWKFCLYSYKVRLKVLNLKLRSGEIFKDSVYQDTLHVVIIIKAVL